MSENQTNYLCATYGSVEERALMMLAFQWYQTSLIYLATDEAHMTSDTADGVCSSLYAEESVGIPFLLQ
jgi:hypothetical protein